VKNITVPFYGVEILNFKEEFIRYFIGSKENPLSRVVPINDNIPMDIKPKIIKHEIKQEIKQENKQIKLERQIKQEEEEERERQIQKERLTELNAKLSDSMGAMLDGSTSPPTEVNWDRHHKKSTHRDHRYNPMSSNNNSGHNRYFNDSDGTRNNHRRSQRHSFNENN